MCSFLCVLLNTLNKSKLSFFLFFVGLLASRCSFFFYIVMFLIYEVVSSNHQITKTQLHDAHSKIACANHRKILCANLGRWCKLLSSRLITACTKMLLRDTLTVLYGSFEYLKKIYILSKLSFEKMYLNLKHWSKTNSSSPCVDFDKFVEEFSFTEFYKAEYLL